MRVEWGARGEGAGFGETLRRFVGHPRAGKRRTGHRYVHTSLSDISIYLHSMPKQKTERGSHFSPDKGHAS